MTEYEITLLKEFVEEYWSLFTSKAGSDDEAERVYCSLCSERFQKEMADHDC